MKYIVTELHYGNFVGCWHVAKAGQTHGNGYESAIFAGPGAEQRAKDYAAWMEAKTSGTPAPQMPAELWGVFRHSDGSFVIAESSEESAKFSANLYAFRTFVTRIK